MNPLILTEMLRCLNGEPALPATMPEIQAPDTTNSVRVERGYNGLESAITHNGNLKGRLITNIDIGGKKYSIGYHGLNEAEANLDGYYGRHLVSAGLKPLKAIAVVKADGKSGVFDVKAGLRTDLIQKFLNGYDGFVDLSFDKESGNLALFYGKEIGAGIEMEIYYELEFQKGSLLNYGEGQVYVPLGKELKAFIRAEIKEGQKDNYLAGLGITF